MSILALCALCLVGPAARVGASAPHAGSMTLNVFDWGAFATANGKKVLAGYKRLHPDITIKILSMPPNDPTVWEESLLAAGQAPDLVVPSYTMQVFGDLGKNYWLDLTPYMSLPNPYVKGNRRWIDNLDPVMNKQNAFVGDRYYVVSWQAQDATFFYNKDLFKQAGITNPPTTWAELQGDCAKIKKASIVPVLYLLGDTYPIAENGSFVSLLENQVMNKTFTQLDSNKDGKVDIQELVYGIKHKIYSPMNADYQEAWKLYKDYAQYWEPNPAGVKKTTLFTTGKAAIMYGGQYTGPALVNAKVKFKWGIFRMPQVTAASSKFATPGEKGVGIWGAWNADAWAIPVSTRTRGQDRLNAVIDFLHWISAPGNEGPVDLDGAQIPVYKGWDPRGSDVPKYPGNPDYFSQFLYLLQHPTMQFPAEATLGPEWLTKRIATQQAYITGMESLPMAMGDMQRYTDQAADKMIKIYNLSVK